MSLIVRILERRLWLWKTTTTSVIVNLNLLTLCTLYTGCKYTRAKYFLNEINCKQPLIYDTVYGRRHSKLFIPTVIFRGTPCI